MKRYRIMQRHIGSSVSVPVSKWLRTRSYVIRRIRFLSLLHPDFHFWLQEQEQRSFYF